MSSLRNATKAITCISLLLTHPCSSHQDIFFCQGCCRQNTNSVAPHSLLRYTLSFCALVGNRIFSLVWLRQEVLPLRTFFPFVTKRSSVFLPSTMAEVSSKGHIVPVPTNLSPSRPEREADGLSAQSCRLPTLPASRSECDDSLTTSPTTPVPPDNSVTTMADLCKDLPHGDLSHRETAMRKIDWAAVKKRRLQTALATTKSRLSSAAKDALTPSLGSPGLTPSSTDQISESSRSKPTTMKVTTKIVNDSIVLIDDSGLERLDRHAEADAELHQLEEVEEDDLTLFFNRSTLANQNRRDPADRISHRCNDRWTQQETDSFFAALRMFGTDFNMLSQMIPGKTRRQVKAKFIREERIDPCLIKSALLTEVVPINLDAYTQASGVSDTDLMDPQTFQRELDQIKASYDLELAQTHADMMKKRPLETHSTDHDSTLTGKRRVRPKRSEQYAGEVEIVTEFND